MKLIKRLISIVFLWCAGVLMLVNATPVRALDHVLETALFHDDAGNNNFDELEQQTFVVHAQPLLLEGSGESYWIRLKVAGRHAVTDAPQDHAGNPRANKQLVLLINPPYVGEVSLYDPWDQGSTPRQASLSQPLEQAEFPVSNLAFVVPLSDAPRHLWLHVKAPRRMLLEVQALLPHEALLVENAKQKRRILSHSLLLLCLGLGLYLWWKDRSLLMMLFVARQALVVTLVWVSDGIVRVSQMPGAQPWQVPLEDLISFGVMLTVAVNTLFFRYFMPLFQVSRTGLRMLWWLLALFPVEMLLWAGGRLDLAQAINSFIILVTPLLIAGMVAHKGLFIKYGPRTAEAPGTSLPLVWSIPVMVPALSLQVVWALHFLGWMQQDWLPVGRETYIALLNGVLIVLVLLEFSKRSSQSQHETELRLNLAVEQQRLERARRQEATEFLAMLTHELKTPLSTIRLALGAPKLTTSSRLRADRAVMDMSHVIDRCAQVETMHDEPQSAPEHDGLLLDELPGLLAYSNEPAVIDLHVDADTPSCTVDTHLLRIVVSNLLDNALKYRLPQSRVEVSVGRLAINQREGLVLRVANLPGISGLPEPGKVFRKYYRSSGAHHFTGSGLGLYLAERLARRMGGLLTHEPHTTQVRFMLWLPT